MAKVVDHAKDVDLMVQLSVDMDIFVSQLFQGTSRKTGVQEIRVR